MIWTLVQITGAGGSGDTCSATFGSPVTAGDLIVAFGANYDGISPVVKDSVNLTNYTQAVYNGGSLMQSGIWWYTPPVGGSGFSVTMTTSAGGDPFPSLSIAEFAFSGLASVDGTPTYSASATNAAPASASITLAGNDLAVSCVATGAAGTVTAGSGWTQGNVVAYGAVAGCFAQYALNLAAGSITPSATISASVLNAICGCAFKWTGTTLFRPPTLSVGAGGPFFSSQVNA